MRKLILITLSISAFVPMLAAVYLLLQQNSTEMPLPTLFVLPSLTASATVPTQSATDTPATVPTAMMTLYPSQTVTESPTFTPTLSTRVVEISVVMPGVNLPPTMTPFPFGLSLIPAPPQPVEPLPDATNVAPPFEGWYSFESDHPNVTYTNYWEPRQVPQASRGQYHRTENLQGSVQFSFEGEGLRIRYVAARNMGIFQIVVDGIILDTIDAYAPELAFPGTRVYFTGQGTHLLELRSTQQKNASSEAYSIGLDAIQVFRGDANTLIIPPPLETSTPTLAPHPAERIELVAHPSTPEPTTTPATPRVINASVVVAHDENGNRAVDPSEGVSGISVRVVEVGTNRVLRQAFTDSSGYAEVQVFASGQTRLVIPYFGKFWDISTGRDESVARFTLLLAPGNQPGLIP